MKLLLATTNKDKIREYRELLKGFKLIVPKILPAVEETGKTYQENAVIKARAYGKKFNRPLIADDTGLEVKTLNGFPGIYSNRFANGNFNRARKEILKRVTTDRGARFVCVIAFYRPGRPVKTFTGAVKGKIAVKERKHFGFGYDPIFIYPGPKMRVGHRVKAAKKFLVYNQNQ